MIDIRDILSVFQLSDSQDDSRKSSCSTRTHVNYFSLVNKTKTHMVHAKLHWGNFETSFRHS